MEIEAVKLGQTVYLDSTMEEALERVTAALKIEGFGVLTEIDVKQTLKNKLDVDFRPYRILGACNPTLAHRALQTVPQVGLLLPCNVTVTEIEKGRIEVSIIDPLVMMEFAGDPELGSIAGEARQRLDRVAESLVEN